MNELFLNGEQTWVLQESCFQQANKISFFITLSLKQP